MVYILSVIFTAIIVSLYFFPIDIVTGFNTKMLMAACGLAVFVVQLAQRKKFLNKDYWYHSIIAVLVSLCGYISMFYNDTNDTTYATYIVSMWVWLGGAFFVVELIKFIHGKCSAFLLCNYLIAVCVFQCVIALAIDMNPVVKSFVRGFYTDGLYYEEHDRLYGIGASLDVAGSRFSAVLCMITCIGMVYGRSLKNNWFIFYGLSFLVIAIIGNMISRTTTVGLVLSVCYWVYSVSVVRENKPANWLKVWKWIFLVLICCLPLIIYYYNKNLLVNENIRFAFEGFFSLIETGEWRVHSNEILQNMYVFPETIKTWLIGDGYFDNPMFSDPYYTGSMRTHYYMGTDVGYLRFIFYFGLVGLLTFIFFFCYSAKICIKHMGSLKNMFILFLVVNFIVWFKVATDIFLVFALFLCIDKEENDAYNQSLLIESEQQ